jgi:hypothetical protein
VASAVFTWKAARDCGLIRVTCKTPITVAP